MIAAEAEYRAIRYTHPRCLDIARSRRPRPEEGAQIADMIPDSPLHRHVQVRALAAIRGCRSVQSRPHRFPAWERHLRPSPMFAPDARKVDRMDMNPDSVRSPRFARCGRRHRWRRPGRADARQHAGRRPGLRVLLVGSAARRSSITRAASAMDDECLRAFQSGRPRRCACLPHTTPFHIDAPRPPAPGRVFASSSIRSTDEFGWPRRNAFIQPLIDRILGRRVAALPQCGAAVWAASPMSFTQDAGGVSVP